MVFWEMVEFRSIRSPRAHYNNTCRVVLIYSLNSLEMKISSNSIKKIECQVCQCLLIRILLCCVHIRRLQFLPDNIS